MRDIVLLKHFPAIGPPTSLGQVYMGPFFYYFMAPWLILWRFHPIGLAYGTALLSIVGLCGVYAIAYTISKKTALLTLILTAFSFTLTYYARFAWNPNLLPYISFAFIFLAFFITKKSRFLLAFLLGSIAAVILQFHLLGIIIVGTGLIYVIIRTKLKNIFGFVSGFILFSVPLIIFDLRHSFLNTRNFVSYLQTGGDSHSSYLIRLLETLQGYGYAILHITIPLFLIPLLAVLILLPLRSKNSFIRINAILVAVFILLFSFIDAPRYPHYFGSIVISGYLIIGHYLLPRPRCKLCWVVTGAMLVLFICANRYTPLFSSTPSQIKTAQDVARIIGKQAKSPLQLTTIPQSRTDEQFRYIIEKEFPVMLLDKHSTDEPKELYVLCYGPCNPLDDPQWHIAAFRQKKIGSVTPYKEIQIYKLVHGGDTIK